jgi:hypothetical protein
MYKYIRIILAVSQKNQYFTKRKMNKTLFDSGQYT